MTPNFLTKKVRQYKKYVQTIAYWRAKRNSKTDRANPNLLTKNLSL